MTFLKNIIIVFVFLINSHVSASNLTPENTQDKNIFEKTGEISKNAQEEITNSVKNSKDLREKSNYFAFLNYSPLDLLIPSKYGLSLGLTNNSNSSWEIEYLRGSISVPFIVEDLGKMTDERISIIRRSYLGLNSFNLSYGLSYFTFSLHLGDDLLNRVSGGNYPSIDLINIQVLGINLALGNRWAFKNNMSFGIDWISLSQPIIETKKNSAFLDYATNKNDKDDVNKAINIITYFPRLAFFKLQFGLLF